MELVERQREGIVVDGGNLECVLLKWYSEAEHRGETYSMTVTGKNIVSGSLVEVRVV